jgi:sn-glycerol 3-phosphate transport system permease protein
MVEKTPFLDTLTYIFLMMGIVIVGFPIIYSIIAATLPIEEVSKVPMPLIPGDQFWVNLLMAWEKGNLGTNLLNSFIMAAGITFGKIVVSMLGAFSIV